MDNTSEEVNFNIIRDSDISIKEKYFNLYNTRAIYHRWSIPDVCKGDKAIYLDADVIVVGDIAELWNIDLEDNYIAAVPTYAERLDFVESIQGGNVRLRHLRNYLSGQMVINCKKWREENFKDKLVDYAIKNNTLDEAPITVLCQGKVHELDKYWCVPASHVEHMKKHKTIKHVYDFEKAKLFHYSGSIKPWKRKGRNYEYYEKYI
jgi:lipopolysaccharide biosynthesis glycosyltransferase